MLQDKSDYLYQPCFCEENVWHLAHALRQEAGWETMNVLFFVNENQTVLLAHQIPFGELSAGCWDYHVVLHCPQRQRVVDFDSSLGFATDTLEYFLRTFPRQSEIAPGFRTVVRRLSVGDYLAGFWSDRSHMKDASGQELAPFPVWPCIRASSQPLKLEDLRRTEYSDPRLDDWSVDEFLASV